MKASLREFVRKRAESRCEYCRLSQQESPFIRFWIEHITAKQHGGADDLSNLAWTCPSCNRFKGPNLSAIDPESGTIAPLFHPRTQAWREHFALRGPRIIGLTAVGRATVRLLQMNSEERMEIRQRLQSLGDWPPG